MKKMLPFAILALGMWLLASCSEQKDESTTNDFLTAFIAQESNRVDQYSSLEKSITYNGEKQSKSIDKNLGEEVKFLNEYLDQFRKTNAWDSLKNGELPEKLTFSTPNGDSLWINSQGGEIVAVKIQNTQSSLFRDAQTAVQYETKSGYRMQESSNMLNLLSNELEIVVEFPQGIE